MAFSGRSTLEGYGLQWAMGLFFSLGQALRGKGVNPYHACGTQHDRNLRTSGPASHVSGLKYRLNPLFIQRIQ